MNFSFVTRLVLILSLVSFFADIASEMLYPVMPLYLKSVQFDEFAIGLLEGMAMLIAGFGKLWFGSLSDILDRRAIFIQSGYFLSAAAKPLFGLFPQVGAIFGIRALDRVGKGMRGSARDAVLVAESKPGDRGKVFGFHRGMDTLGAVVGPLLALAWLQFHPGDYITLFFIAFGPGMIGVLLTLLVKDRQPRNPNPGKARPFKGIFKFWKIAPPEYKRLLAGFILFSLINSTDLFLILKAHSSGMKEVSVIGAYLFYNLVYALASFPMGALADRTGFKNIYLLSIGIFAITYLGFSLTPSESMIWILFALYGLFTASHGSIAKSWISLYLPKDKRATGIGLYQFLHTMSLFVASPAAGLLWAYSSGEMMFQVAGIAALGLGVLLIFLLPSSKPAQLR